MAARMSFKNLAQVLQEEMQALGRDFAERSVESDAKLGRVPLLRRLKLKMQTVRRALVGSGVTARTLADEWRKAHLRDVRDAIFLQQKSTKPLTALCFSGGGIRSASFCLGVLQRLAGNRLLSKFDYLSTVSGGGYIGSWLKAWAYRLGKTKSHGITAVEEELRTCPSEPVPVRYLRYYTNYLAPRMGLMSADTWSMVSSYLRNLLLTWLVLVPLLMLPLLMPMMYLAGILVLDDWPMTRHATLTVGLVALLVALVTMRVCMPRAGRPGLSQRAFLLACLLPLVVAATDFSLWLYAIQNDVVAQQSINFWAWLPGSVPWDLHTSLFDFSSLLGLTVGFYLLAYALERAWLAVQWVIERAGARERRKSLSRLIGDRIVKPLQELVAALVTAVVAAGLLAWWASMFLPSDGLLFTCFAPPMLLGVATLTETFYIGIASYFTDDMDREFWARAGAWDLIVIVGWVALSAISLYGPLVIENLDIIVQSVLGAMGLAAGGVSALIGKSAMTAAQSGQPGAKSPLNKLLSKLALPALLVIFIVVLLAFLAYLASWALWVTAYLLDALSPALALLMTPDHQLYAALLDGDQPSDFMQAAPPTIVFLTLVTLWAFERLMGAVINVNWFSLHSFYRNRLLRAYLGASRGRERKPNLFSGFDPKDNLHMRDFVERGTVERPLHVINIALNLVHGENLAWQERKAAAFTVTALHAGSYDVGYQETKLYGGPGGISLGTALAISGAAFSPNSGYHSFPALTFVMSFFNVRLGWWLGNPQFKTARQSGPNHAAKPLMDEALGLTDDQHDWVYLSDGGHFDNLGVYEMVSRCVRRIVVIDAGADPKFQFEDLGNAIRKIRADFGIPIDREGPMCVANRTPSGAYCATFVIRYSAVYKIAGLRDEDVDGELLYIKPVVNGTEPSDVTQYAAVSETFPHETTSDQFFSESQFESYRALGMHEIDVIVGTVADIDVQELINSGRRHSKQFVLP